MTARRTSILLPGYSRRAAGVIEILFALMMGCGTGDVDDPDAATDPNDAARDCAIVSELGRLDPRSEPVAYATGDGGTVVWRFALNTEDPADYLWLGLFSGYGAMSEGIGPGAFELVGDELNYSTCGICITLLGDGRPMGNQVVTENYYMATAGRVVLESTDGRLIGELSDFAFEHVDIDPETLESTPVDDGCRATISTLQFDVEIVAL